MDMNTGDSYEVCNCGCGVIRDGVHTGVNGGRCTDGF